MAGDRLRIRLHTADRMIVGTRQGSCRGQFPYSGARDGIKKDAIGADELQRVPLDRVMAGGENDAAGGAMVLNRQLYRGCCN